MIEFFEKYGVFFIVVTIVGSFVMYSVKKEEKSEKEKAEKEKREKDTQKKIEESQKKEEK